MDPTVLDRMRKLNDEFRARLSEDDGDMLWQAAVLAKGQDFRKEVLKAIREYRGFDEYQEVLHDFGVVVVEGEELEWTIEVLNPDPADPALGRRALTVFRRSQ